jgi:hypothetical protein
MPGIADLIGSDNIGSWSTEKLISAILMNSTGLGGGGIGGFGSFKTHPLYAGELQSGIDKYYGQSLSNLSQDRNQAVSQAGSLASGRGYSMGLNNPFAYAQRAEQGTYGQYGGAMGDLLGRRAQSMSQAPLQAFGTQLSANQANSDLLTQLLSIRQGGQASRQQLEAQQPSWLDYAGALAPLIGLL